MRLRLTVKLLLAAVLAGSAGGAQPQQPVPAAQGPLLLGAASHFSQGWRGDIADAAFALGVVHYRDGLRWAEVEREPGRYSFTAPRTAYLARLAERGGDVVLTVNFGHPRHDDGATPHSPQGLAAFRRFIAATLEAHPGIRAVEVGNEFNSANFVSGPVRQAGIAARGRYHLAMVEAAAGAVADSGRAVPVWGGSVHSIPAGYLWPVLEADTARRIEALAIHPYTTPIDQIPAQFEVLRRHPAARTRPVAVTEFASRDRAAAGDDLLRAYATLAALGVRALYWYPLSDRGDGTVGLLTDRGEPTSAGEAFRLVQRELAGLVARDLSPDPFTRAIGFGDNVLVLWGEPRALELTRPDIRAFDARGREVERGALALSASAPLLLRGSAPLRLGQEVRLGCSTLVADSFYQFAYPGGAPRPAGLHFAPIALLGGREQPFATMPGQQRAGVPWTPYLGVDGNPGLRLAADGLALAGRGTGATGVVHRFAAPGGAALELELELELQPGRNSAPIALEITANGAQIHASSGTGAVQLRRPIHLDAAGEVRVAMAQARPGSRSNATYRLRMHDSSHCSRQ